MIYVIAFCIGVAGAAITLALWGPVSDWLWFRFHRCAEPTDCD